MCRAAVRQLESEKGAGLRSYFNWAPKKKRKPKNGNILKKDENNQSYFCTTDVCVLMRIDI